MAYHLVAVDFLPPAVTQASLARLAAEFASGGPKAQISCTSRKLAKAAMIAHIACLYIRKLALLLEVRAQES